MGAGQIRADLNRLPVRIHCLLYLTLFLEQQPEIIQGIHMVGRNLQDFPVTVNRLLCPVDCAQRDPQAEQGLVPGRFDLEQFFKTRDRFIMFVFLTEYDT